MSITTYIALLCGINVGGKNKLPMRDLTARFIDAGCSNVRTYIQSGNVIFNATTTLAEKLPHIISDAISKKYRLSIPILTRSIAELKKVANNNPFLKHNSDVNRLHVLFLRDKPTKAAINKLDSNRSSPDEFVINGSEIYLRCPNGVARTKLTTQYFDSFLSTISTMRNWKRVLKLLDIAEEI